MKGVSAVTNEHEAPAQINQGLVGGIQCLLALAAAETPVGSRDLARRLGMDPTRTNRLLGTLAYLGLAQRTPDRKYTAGSGLHVLSAMSLHASRLLRVAMPLVEELSRNTDHVIALGVLWGRQVCYLVHGKANESMTASIGGHFLFPAEQSSIGKVLLGARQEADVRELYHDANQEMREELIQELRQVQKQGAAFGVTGSIAVPVASPAIAGLAVSDVEDRRAASTLIPALKQTADRIAAEMQ